MRGNNIFEMGAPHVQLASNTPKPMIQQPNDNGLRSQDVCLRALGGPDEATLTTSAVGLTEKSQQNGVYKRERLMLAAIITYVLKGSEQPLVEPTAAERRSVNVPQPRRACLSTRVTSWTRTRHRQQPGRHRQRLGYLHHGPELHM